MSWKKYVLVISKVLRMFVNILTADDKCFLLNRDNLRKPIQMQLSEKEKNFFEICFGILISTINFEHSQNKVDPHS